MIKKLLAVLSLASLSLSALAVPVASGPALAGSGNGLNSTWVDTVSVHSLAAAQAAFADPNNSRVSLPAPYLNYSDAPGNSNFPGQIIAPPANDDSFVVRFTGYLNIVDAGTYSFRARTDDGFSFVLGGETIVAFPVDRGPGDSFASVFLDSGLYGLDFLVWEQGGAFVAELDWTRPGDTAYSLVPQSALFTVPEPGSLALFGIALAGLARRRR